MFERHAPARMEGLKQLFLEECHSGPSRDALTGGNLCDLNATWQNELQSKNSNNETFGCLLIKRPQSPTVVFQAPQSDVMNNL